MATPGVLRAVAGTPSRQSERRRWVLPPAKKRKTPQRQWWTRDRLKLKWIYEVFYRKRGDLRSKEKIAEIRNCQSIEEVRTAFYSNPRFKGMRIARCRRLRKMVPEDLEKLVAPAKM